MTIQFNRRNLLRAATTGALLTATGAAGAALAKPAHVEEQLPLLGPKPGVALLARNENPYGPSKKAQEAIQYGGLKGAYYPDNAAAKLMSMIAERHDITPDHVTLSTGSGEVLSAIALAYGAKGKILAPALFWDTTVLYAERKGAAIVRAPMKPDLSVDLDAMEALVDDNVSLVHICNPNNPTGEVLDPEALKAFCKRVSKKATILIDEAYNEITDDPDKNSMIGLVREGYDVIVTRTFSKIYGMAGVRMGYAMAAPEKTAMIRDYVMSWVAGVGLVGAAACYEDRDFMAFSKGKIVEAREMVIDAVKANGLEYFPSQTNFVFVKLPGDADDFRAKMAERGILIRGVYGDLVHWSRVSMGFIEDVERYVKALPQVLNA